MEIITCKTRIAKQELQCNVTVAKQKLQHNSDRNTNDAMQQDSSWTKSLRSHNGQEAQEVLADQKHKKSQRIKNIKKSQRTKNVREVQSRYKIQSEVLRVLMENTALQPNWASLSLESHVCCYRQQKKALNINRFLEKKKNQGNQHKKAEKQEKPKKNKENPFMLILFRVFLAAYAKVPTRTL